MSKIIITCNEASRGGKTLKIKQIVDQALANTNLIEKVIVFKLEGNGILT